MNRMTVYVSGPVTGLPDNNAGAFNEAEKILRGREDVLTVINPVRIGQNVEYLFKNVYNAPVRREDYMRACIRELTRATHIAYLPGWEHSRGAKLEHAIADSLGIEEIK
jgi:hypothetical protein